MSPIANYDAIRERLNREFAEVETAVLRTEPPQVPHADLTASFDGVFASATQAYREVLLGCVLAKLTDPTINVHKPYVSQGTNAYNGRTLDERVVNPFLASNRIPCSRAPFLSAFRRSVTFEPATRVGLRDKEGYDALLVLIDWVDDHADADSLTRFLRYLLFRFVQLRDAADIPLARLQRISLEQYATLIEGILATPSGGRFPVILVEAAFIAIRESFELDWTIDVQGINEADRPGGAGGDITIRHRTRVLLTAEVTERPVERNRVVSTFQAKIAPGGIEEYLFFVRNPVDEDVMRQARQYFAQGHEINFLEMKNWLTTILATVGRRGRDTFNAVIVEKLRSPDVPATLKVAWNEQIGRITAA